MCMICVDYKKLDFKDLVRNATELCDTNAEHAEDFFYMLEKEDPETLSKLEKYFWDKLTSQLTSGFKNG